MEELPILDGKQRAELLDTLNQAETEIAAGEGVAYQPKRFRDRLLRIYRAVKR